MKAGLPGDYTIEPLLEQHERSLFECGVQELDNYFRKQAGQDLRRNLSAPFVLIHKPTQAIAGFYTLSNTAIEAADLPPDLARKLPKYPLVPGTLLRRLAVDRGHSGHGLGELLLLDALSRSLAVSREIASYALVVQTKNERAAGFYKKYGFIPFLNRPGALFIPMRTIAQLFPG
ncbi:MAG TPA: GNAT family N-acetyltransferase [Verrucomicrobiae bacterium]|jgi:ribosomal protein S18 acetylase RimI-like enzyme